MLCGVTMVAAIASQSWFVLALGGLFSMAYYFWAWNSAELVPTTRIQARTAARYGWALLALFAVFVAIKYMSER